MIVVSVLLAASTLAALVFYLRKSGAGGAVLTPGRLPQPVSAPAAAPATPVAKPAALLAELDALAWVRAEALPERRREAIASVFKHVPRPPRLMQQLISPEFVNNASLEELAELIGSEPLVATRVLATANSPMFGLATPVKGVQQAISTLGLITLRILCLQYLMIRSFKADSPERQRLLTNVWNASALASELCQRVARGIGRPDPGRLVTLVVLSFLGRLASKATMPRGLLAIIPVGSFLERTRNEQATLGLSAGEIGGLLMHDWALPASLIDDVRRVDPCLVERAPALDLALCYVSARLGEKLASGQLARLSDFDLARDESADFHHIQSRLSRPDWAAMAAALRDPALGETMDAMARALREGTAAP